MAGFPAYSPPPTIERGGKTGLVAVIRSGARRGTVLTLTQDAGVGRNEHHDLHLPDSSVSQDHARLELEGGRWKAIDLGSTNGTTIEGTKLAPDERVTLRSGTIVHFGHVEVGFAFGPTVEQDSAALTVEPGIRRGPLSIALLLLLTITIVAFLIF